MNNNIIKINPTPATMPTDLTREYFMKSTGVFVTHNYYEMIQDNFKRSGLSPDKFCDKWLSENDSMIVSIEPSINKLEFILEDDFMVSPKDDQLYDDLTAADLIESLSKELKFYYDRYQKLMDAMVVINDLIGLTKQQPSVNLNSVGTLS